MLDKKNLEAYVCDKRSMSQFKNTKFDLYRSTNKILTEQYFGEKSNSDGSFFELIVFNYNYDKQQFYLRYPNTDFYIELKGHSGSSCGTMTEAHLRNLIEEVITPWVYEGVLRTNPVTVYKHETEAIIMFGRYSTSGFNFLTKEENINVDDVMSREYIPLPEYRAIQYSLVTPDNNYIIVDADDNMFTYESMNCYYGNLKDGIKKGKISNFLRYRDGGTTLFDFELNEVKHKFFYPSQLGNTDKLPTWDDKPVVEMDENLQTLICSQLNIKLAPKVLE